MHSKKELVSFITEELLVENLLNLADAESIGSLKTCVQETIMDSLKDFMIISGTELK